MNVKIPPTGKALNFIVEMKDLGDKYWNDSQIQHLIQMLEFDLETKTLMDSQRYLEQIFFSIPPKLFPYLLESLALISEGEIGRKIILYLLLTDRPVYQIKALQMIIKRGRDNFAPYIIPLIFSAHLPLKKQAITTIVTVPGSAELILEQTLNDRSKKRQQQAMQILKMINPNNHRLSLKKLDSEDFVDRINGITHLSDSSDPKWIPTIERFLIDDDISVRKAAIEGISKIGGKKAKKILVDHLQIQDFDPLIRLITQNIQEMEKMG